MTGLHGPFIAMILLTAAGFKAMQDDGAAVPGLSLLLHCQLEFSEVFEE